MAFKLTTRNLGEVTILDLSGRLELGQGSTVLRETLQGLPSGTKVLLNLTGVAFLDTSGLGELVSGHTKAQNEGTRLKLSGVPVRVEKLFQMTNLDRIFAIYDTEAEAIESWSESSLPSDRLRRENVA